MFVAVAFDLGSDDHRSRVQKTLQQYGFQKIQSSLYESLSVDERLLVRLKKELDGLTDSYDSLRFYQYPMEDTLVITALREKKWRKLIVNTGK